MREALHIFKKDSRYLRVPIAILLAWTALLVYASVTTIAVYDLQWGAGFAFTLLRYAPYMLALGWLYLIAQVVHADALHGDRQFWLTRPHRRGSLLVGKLLFVLAYVAVPMGLAQAAIVMAMGFSLVSSLPSLLWSQGILIGLIFVPMLALASTTATIGWLVAMLVPIPVLLAAFLQTGRGLASLDWVRFSAAILPLEVAAVLILWVQYGRRQTRLAQLILLVGIAAMFVVSGSIDWDKAFAAQQVADGARETSLTASLAPSPGRSTPSPVPLSVGQFQLRFAFDGLQPDALISCEATRIAVVTPSGVRFDQPVRTVATGQLSRVVDGCAGFVVLPQDELALADGPVSIEADVYVTTFNPPVETALPLGHRQAVSGYGSCLAQPRGVAAAPGNQPLTFVDVICDTAFRPPAVAASFKAGGENTSPYRPDYSPFPAELRIQPIERIGRTFRTSEMTASVITRSVRAHERLRVNALNVDLKPYQVVRPR